MSTLFKALVKVAHDHPETRADLLPVLRESSSLRKAGTLSVRVMGRTWTVTIESLHDVNIEGPRVDEYGSLSRRGELEDFTEVPDEVLAALEREIKSNARKLRMARGDFSLSEDDESDEVTGGRVWKKKDNPNYGPPYSTVEYSKKEPTNRGPGNCYYQTGDEGSRCYVKRNIGDSSNRKEYNKKWRKEVLKSASMRDSYKLFSRNSYLYKFFKEKGVRSRVFDFTDSTGMEHAIPNAVVVEYIAQTRGRERKEIEDILRKIDFKNGDVNHFLEHLAGAVAEDYAGVLRSASGESMNLRNKIIRLAHDNPELRSASGESMNLRNKIIRLAHDNPELRGDLLPLLKATKKASHDKQALSGKDVMNELMEAHGGTRGIVNAMQSIREKDEQSGSLYYKVYGELLDALTLTRGQNEAFSRFVNVTRFADKWSPALLRNNIFKAADSLGVKLPSGMFASDQGSDE